MSQSYADNVVIGLLLGVIAAPTIATIYILVIYFVPPITINPEQTISEIHNYIIGIASGNVTIAYYIEFIILSLLLLFMYWRFYKKLKK